MVKYIFMTEYSPKNLNAIAFFDQIGRAQCYYLPEFVEFFKDQNIINLEDVLIPFLCGTFAHEDLHEAISDVIDTSPEQEHSIMDSICEFMNSPHMGS